MNERGRRLLDVLLVANLVLVAVIAYRSVGIQRDVEDLKQVMTVAAESQATQAQGVAQSIQSLAQTIQQIHGQPAAGMGELAAKVDGAARVLAKCGQCHEVDRLRELYLMEPEKRLSTIERMVEKPDFHPGAETPDQILAAFTALTGFHQDQWITDQQAEMIEASIVLQKCRRCHKSVLLRELYGMEAEERSTTIERMAQKPESHIGMEDTAKILRAFKVFTASH